MVQPSVAGTFIYLQPVLALVVTWLTVQGGVELGWMQGLSALCIFLGVWLVGRKERVAEAE